MASIISSFSRLFNIEKNYSDSVVLVAHSKLTFAVIISCVIIGTTYFGFRDQITCTTTSTEVNHRALENYCSANPAMHFSTR